MAYEQTLEQIIHRFELAKSDRAVWESHWQEVADFVRPEHSFTTTYTRGEKRRNQIYDDTAPNAADNLAAALDGMLTNTSIRWFGLVPDDPAIEVTEELEAGLYDTTSRMLRFFESPESGFATATHEVYLDLVCFGTGVMLMTETNGNLRFQARSLSSIYLEQDDEGNVVGVHRCFRLNAVEMAELWGDAVDAAVMKLAKDGNREQKFEMLHSITKRSEFDPQKADPINMPWSSCYVDLSHKTKLSEGGFPANPFVTPRWGKVAEEPYGRSPAMRMLPSIKAINVMSRTVLEAAEMTVRPPLMVPANGIEGNVSTRPGSLIYVRQGTREFPQPLQHGARPDFGETELERRGLKISEAFYADRLRLPENDRMTATEIVARRQQGLLTASPILARLYSEMLNPIIARTFDWMARTNRLPPLPVQGRLGLAISYQSPLAASRAASQTQSFQEVLMSVIPLAQLKPTIIDNIDEDEATRLLARFSNLDPRFLKKRSAMQKLRRDQAQQQQTAMALAAAEQGAGAAKDAASAASELSGGANGNI